MKTGAEILKELRDAVMKPLTPKRAGEDSTRVLICADCSYIGGALKYISGKIRHVDCATEAKRGKKERKRRKLVRAHGVRWGKR